MYYIFLQYVKIHHIYVELLVRIMYVYFVSMLIPKAAD